MSSPMSTEPSANDGLVVSSRMPLSSTSRSRPPFFCTYWPILSAALGASPFPSVISFRTSSHGN